MKKKWYEVKYSGVYQIYAESEEEVRRTFKMEEDFLAETGEIDSITLVEEEM